MNTPSHHQIREAWSILRCGYQPIRFRTYNEAYDAAWEVLEDALGQPPNPGIPSTAPVHYPWQNKPCDDCGGTLDAVLLSDEDWGAIQAGRPGGIESRGHYICSRCVDSAARRVNRRVVGIVHYGWENTDGPGLVINFKEPDTEE